MTARQWTREALDVANPLPKGWTWAFDESVGWHARHFGGATVCIDDSGDVLSVWNGTTLLSPHIDVALPVILASKGLDSLGAMADACERFAKAEGGDISTTPQDAARGAYLHAEAMLRRGRVEP